MTKNDKARTGQHNRRRIGKDEDREVRSLMRKTGSSYSQVPTLKHRYGHDLAGIERSAQRLRTT